MESTAATTTAETASVELTEQDDKVRYQLWCGKVAPRVPNVAEIPGAQFGRNRLQAVEDIGIFPGPVVGPRGLCMPGGAARSHMGGERA